MAATCVDKTPKMPTTIKLIYNSLLLNKHCFRIGSLDDISSSMFVTVEGKGNIE